MHKLIAGIYAGNDVENTPIMAGTLTRYFIKLNFTSNIL